MNKKDDDREITLLTLDQLAQTLEVMNQLVKRLQSSLQAKDQHEKIPKPSLSPHIKHKLH